MTRPLMIVLAFVSVFGVECACADDKVVRFDVPNFSRLNATGFQDKDLRLPALRMQERRKNHNCQRMAAIDTDLQPVNETWPELVSSTRDTIVIN